MPACSVSTHSRPKAAGPVGVNSLLVKTVSTHSRPKAAGHAHLKLADFVKVSTHSRPKAAGRGRAQAAFRCVGFNSQPPEGGWVPDTEIAGTGGVFQLTAARRRLVNLPSKAGKLAQFQLTAARRRLGGGKFGSLELFSFNSQPPEGGWFSTPLQAVSAAWFQLTAARRRLGLYRFLIFRNTGFQLTAARRRLEPFYPLRYFAVIVSTHSRPKAAGQWLWRCVCAHRVSTHSRPKAAGLASKGGSLPTARFNSQPPEGGW